MSAKPGFLTKQAGSLITLKGTQRGFAAVKPNDHSTRYVLVDPGEEYLIVEPSETANPFTVELAAGSYTVEWYSFNNRETAGVVPVDNPSPVRFSAPFAAAGTAVLYLKKWESDKKE